MMSDRCFVFESCLKIAQITNENILILFTVRTHRRTGSHGNTPFNPADLVTNPPTGSDASHPQLHHTVTAPGWYQRLMGYSHWAERTGTKTGTETWARTTVLEQGPGPEQWGQTVSAPFWFKCNVKASTLIHTTYLFPVHVLVSALASVNAPSVLLMTLYTGSRLQWVQLLQTPSCSEQYCFSEKNTSDWHKFEKSLAAMSTAYNKKTFMN